MISDVTVGYADPVGPLALPQILSDVFRGSADGWFRLQEGEADVVQYLNGGGEMLSSLVGLQHGMGVGGDLLAHRRGVGSSRDGCSLLASLTEVGAAATGRHGPRVLWCRRAAAPAGGHPACSGRGALRERTRGLRAPRGPRPPRSRPVSWEPFPLAGRGAFDIMSRRDEKLALAVPADSVSQPVRADEAIKAEFVPDALREIDEQPVHHAAHRPCRRQFNDHHQDPPFLLDQSRRPARSFATNQPPAPVGIEAHHVLDDLPGETAVALAPVTSRTVMDGRECDQPTRHVFISQAPGERPKIDGREVATRGDRHGDGDSLLFTKRRILNPPQKDTPQESETSPTDSRPCHLSRDALCNHILPTRPTILPLHVAQLAYITPLQEQRRSPTPCLRIIGTRSANPKALAGTPKCAQLATELATGGTTLPAQYHVASAVLIFP